MLVSLWMSHIDMDKLYCLGENWEVWYYFYWVGKWNCQAEIAWDGWVAQERKFRTGTECRFRGRVILEKVLGTYSVVSFTLCLTGVYTFSLQLHFAVIWFNQLPGVVLYLYHQMDTPAKIEELVKNGHLSDPAVARLKLPSCGITLVARVMEGGMSKLNW